MRIVFEGLGGIGWALRLHGAGRSVGSCPGWTRGSPRRAPDSLVRNAPDVAASARSHKAQVQSVSPKIGLLRIHRPPVKSGKLTGWLPVAIERSDSGEIAIQLAVS